MNEYESTFERLAQQSIDRAGDTKKIFVKIYRLMFAFAYALLVIGSALMRIADQLEQLKQQGELK